MIHFRQPDVNIGKTTAVVIVKTIKCTFFC